MRRTGIAFGVPVLSLLVVANFTGNTAERTNPTTVYSDHSAVLGIQQTVRPFHVSLGTPTRTATNNPEIVKYSLPVTIMNDGQEPLQISPGLHMFVADATGTMIPATAQYAAPDAHLGGTALTGTEFKQSIDFSIPADVQPQRFIFENDMQYRTEVPL